LSERSDRGRFYLRVASERFYPVVQVIHDNHQHIRLGRTRRRHVRMNANEDEGRYE
jgi:hypothetical protein